MYIVIGGDHHTPYDSLFFCLFDVLAHGSVQSLEDVERTGAVAGAAASLTCLAVEAAFLLFCVA